MTKALSDEERDAYSLLVAREIKKGICPFGELKEGQTMAHCPLGFPGCGCADEIMLNPYLQRDHEYAMPDFPPDQEPGPDDEEED